MARWSKLMEPFNRVATLQQKEEARAFWSRAGEWGPSVNHPMTKEVAEFIQAARLVQEAGSAKRGTLKWKHTLRHDARRGEKPDQSISLRER